MIRRDERGASMVEFAILLPLLLLVLIGIIDFGRLFLAEAMVTNAAREGARVVAMGFPTSQADVRVTEALPEVASYGGLAPTVYTTCPAAPAPADKAVATVSVSDFQWLAIGDIVALFGPTLDPPTPSSTAVMRCLG